MVCQSVFVFLPLLLRLRRDSRLGEFLQSFAIAITMQENCIPGYKSVDSSVGILSPGTQARIIREDGTDGGVGEPGELWVKGESISRGYFNDEEATERTFTEDGWLKTGDIFTIDEKGNL